MVFPKKKSYKLQCEWGTCQRTLEYMDDFYQHLEDHFWNDVATFPIQPGSTVVCQWCECNFATTDGHELIRHIFFHGFHTKVKWLGLKMHESSKLEECQVQQNRNIIPDLPDGFRCCWEDCSVVVDIPDKFYDHVHEHAVISDLEKFSDKKEGFRCRWEGCSYTYHLQNKQPISFARHKLKGHMSTHTQERSYACPWCGNLYVNKTKLIDHFARQINAENHSFQCTHCSRTFASERILKDHMRHHVNHYQCPKCAMTCPNPSALKHHIRYKHSTERPYACEFCEYRSKEPHDLQTHMQFHQSDLAYHCQVADCDYVVRSLQNLRYHYRIKHGSGDGKFYACHMCDKTYATGYQLTHHLRKAHSFQWPPGHCRFRYKECEDGKFRLQTFRYESLELTKQLTLVEPQPSTDANTVNPSSTSGTCKAQPTVTKTRSKRICKRFSTKNKGSCTSQNTSPTKQLPASTVRKSKRCVSKCKTEGVLKGTPSKTKPKQRSPKKRTRRKITTPKRHLKSQQMEENLESLPDLFINSESLEAADTLCNLKINSVKKGHTKSRTASDIENDVTIDSVSSTLAGGMDNSQEMQEEPTRKRSGDPTQSDLKFAKARKRLRLTQIEDCFVDLSKAKELCTAKPVSCPGLENSPESSYSGVLMECNVALEHLEIPVFPNHHEIYCNSVNKVNTAHDSSLFDSNRMTTLTTLTEVNSVSSVDPISTESWLLNSGCSGSLSSKEIPDFVVSTSHALTNENNSTISAESSVCTENLVNLSDIQSEHVFSTGHTTDKALESCAGAEHFSANNSEVASGENANSEFNSANNQVSKSHKDGHWIPVHVVDKENRENRTITSEDVDDVDGNSDDVKTEVNKSEIVTDEEGNRTVVNVGGEKYYLVCGIDAKTEEKVFCLVKTSEFIDDDVIN